MDPDIALSTLACSVYSLDWTTGLEYWTGLLTGLLDSTQNGVNNFSSLFSVGEKLIMVIQPTPLLNLLPLPVQATLQESVEVKGRVTVENKL